MSDKFTKELEYVSGSDAYVIWKDLNPGLTTDINTQDSIKELINFFCFAISKNIIIEYNCATGVPVFSGDAPEIVAKRIFNDFSTELPCAPTSDPLSDDRFLGYLITKRGWAVLVRGTTLVFPE